MKYRSVALIVALALLAAPLAPAARPPRIGVLLLTSPEIDNTRRAAGLREGLRDLGYVEGQSVVLEYRYAEGKPEQLPGLAAGLVQARVDVIVAVGFQAAMAARAATTTIPIVMAPVGDPIGRGLVASLARPGGNVTGVSLMSPEVRGKRLSLLKEVVPRLSRVGVVHDPTQRSVLKDIERAAVTLGLQVEWLEIPGPEMLDALRQRIRAARVQALYAMEHPVTDGIAPGIAEIARQERLPTVFPFREAVEAGGLMSYATSITALQRRAATHVHRLLNGASPAELPVEQPTKFELVVNMRTAKTLGLTIPPSILVRADQIIE